MMTAIPAQPVPSGSSDQNSQPQRTPQNMKLYSNGATLDDGATR